MADERDADGCADDQSVGVRSALVHKGGAAHKPFAVRQQEHHMAAEEKKKPSVRAPLMNKGFRDVRQSHHNYSYYSKNHGLYGASHLEIAEHAHLHMSQSTRSSSGGAGKLAGLASKVNSGGASVGQGSTTSRRSGAGSDAGGSFDGNDMQMAGSMDSSGSRLDHDQATTSLVFLNSSIAMTNNLLVKKNAKFTRNKVDKPSTAGAFPMTGSMRVGQKKILSGNFPEFSNFDLALESNPAKDMGVARSDIANAKTKPAAQILDSASLLAIYANSKGGMKAVGAQRRHLGLAEMRRRGGRPLTSQSGPHLHTTSTVGRASSLGHVCAKQC